MISHPLRRAFHERASDTLVITLKEEYDNGPLLLERRFVGSWLRMFFLMVFLSAGLYGFKTYRLVQEGYFAGNISADKSFLCSQIPGDAYYGSHRQDVAIGMYLMDEVSPECLNKEADYALWNSLEGDKTWAYLAKAVVSEDKADQEKYFAQVCDLDPKGETCAIAGYLSEDDGGGGDLLRRHGLVSVTSRVLLLDDVLGKKNYLSAVVLIRDLQKEALLKAPLEKRYVRSVWALNDQQKKSLRRQPASDEVQNVLQDFKEKYGVQ